MVDIANPVNIQNVKLLIKSLEIVNFKMIAISIKKTKTILKMIELFLKLFFSVLTSILKLYLLERRNYAR
jgi:hypothetical protein